MLNVIIILGSILGYLVIAGIVNAIVDTITQGDGSVGAGLLWPITIPLFIVYLIITGISDIVRTFIKKFTK